MLAPWRGCKDRHLGYRYAAAMCLCDHGPAIETLSRLADVAGAIGNFIVTPMALVAETEGWVIGERTKAALAAAQCGNTARRRMASAARKSGSWRAGCLYVTAHNGRDKNVFIIEGRLDQCRLGPFYDFRRWDEADRVAGNDCSANTSDTRPCSRRLLPLGSAVPFNSKAPHSNTARTISFS